jgi:hypothetical protein
MINLVEMVAEEQCPSPCKHGNYVEFHAVYCHHPSPNAPRKCPIYRSFGIDPVYWHNKGDWDKDEDWEGGCTMFEGLDKV